MLRHMRATQADQSVRRFHGGEDLGGDPEDYRSDTVRADGRQ
jgi:hypothetical protein